MMRRFVIVTATLMATATAAQTPTKEQEKPFISVNIDDKRKAPFLSNLVNC